MRIHQYENELKSLITQNNQMSHALKSYQVALFRIINLLERNVYHLFGSTNENVGDNRKSQSKSVATYEETLASVGPESYNLKRKASFHKG